MIFTAKRMRQFVNNPSVAAMKCAEYLEAYAVDAGVDTFLRRCHFLGQVAVECSRFTRFSENLNYSAKGLASTRLHERAAELEHKPEAIANAMYANRNGNGNEASGDGYRFRGRGLIQLTGRSNYLAAGAAIGVDLVADPDQAGKLENAVRIALWFWDSHDCNDAADRDDVEAVTRIINGGVNGLDERRALTDRAKTIFTDDEPLVA